MPPYLAFSFSFFLLLSFFWGVVKLKQRSNNFFFVASGHFYKLSSSFTVSEFDDFEDFIIFFLPQEFELLHLATRVSSSLCCQGKSWDFSFVQIRIVENVYFLFWWGWWTHRISGVCPPHWTWQTQEEEEEEGATNLSWRMKRRGGKIEKNLLQGMLQDERERCMGNCFLYDCQTLLCCLLNGRGWWLYRLISSCLLTRNKQLIDKSFKSFK